MTDSPSKTGARPGRVAHWFLGPLALLLGCQTQTSDPGRPFSRLSPGEQRLPGLFDLRIDPDRGRVLMEIPAPDSSTGLAGQFLYVESLVTGLGSNPVGLDRGQLGRTRLLQWRRLGSRLFLEQVNLRYRALSAREAERRAVRESFASSALWATEILSTARDGRLLIDLSSFLLSDVHDISGTLRRRKQGSFKLDPSRSSIVPMACLAFPDNLELEALLTFGGDEPGADLGRTAPARRSVSFRQHHSFIRLPPDGYQPRRSDPRVGYGTTDFLDYATPLDAPLQRSYLMRHRLEKTDPTEEHSPVREPIVYYVDQGAPPDILLALIEGASWWTEAFERAGFEGAFRVEPLPEGVHPLDVRYNVIQWVHRSTRGWSYGGSISDPRTGEILKGQVTLGSLRVRQDRLLFEGLAGTGKTGSGAADDPVELALARIRQLAAHEVGHTLGLAHNFAASSYGGRASVMDYPAPLIEVTPEGQLDFRRAYGVGLGSYDLHAIHFGYGSFDTPADAAAFVKRGVDSGLLFVSDENARSVGSAHPQASVWDNGADAVAALRLSLRVREIALERFGADNLRPGIEFAKLEEVLAPVYFHHRYQLEAAAKLIGGREFQFVVRSGASDPTEIVKIVSAERQLQALEALLDCAKPAVLDLPDRVLDLLAPRARSRDRNRELFSGYADPLFDPLAAAEAAAGHLFATLLDPNRLARVVEQHRRRPELPGLGQILRRAGNRLFENTPDLPRRRQAFKLVAQTRFVAQLIQLAENESALSMVRSRTHHALEQIRARLEQSEAEQHHVRWLSRQIQVYLELGRPMPLRPAPARALPPGSPIGSAPDCDF